MDAVAIVEGEVRELIRRRGVDPSRDVVDVRLLVEEAVADDDTRSLSGGLPPLPDPGAAVKTVLDVAAGLGPMQPYLDDPRVEEIWVNDRPTQVCHVPETRHPGRTSSLFDVYQLTRDWLQVIGSLERPRWPRCPSSRRRPAR